MPKILPLCAHEIAIFIMNYVVMIFLCVCVEMDTPSPIVDRR